MAEKMTPLQTGINTYGYMWTHDLRACVEQLAALGFRQFEGMITPPHLDTDSTSQERISLRRYMEQEGLSFTSLNLPSLDTNLASSFRATRQYTVSLFCEALQLAADLGAPRLVTVPGRASPLSPAPDEISVAYVKETVGALIPSAREAGVKLAIENVPFSVLPTAAGIRAFLDDMGNEDVLCACYDIANAHFIGEDPRDGVRSLGRTIELVHCSDTTRRHWRHARVGEGDAPFDLLRNALEELNYGGAFLLEIIAPDIEQALLDSQAALARIGLVRDSGKE